MEPTASERYQALFQAVEALAQGSMHATASYVALEDMIGDGAPLNPPTPEEPSLIVPLVAAWKVHGERLANHLRLLVHSGANPMLRGVFSATLLREEDEVADYLLCAMARAEQSGLPMRDEKGQTPLHVCMTSETWQSCPNSPQWMRDRYPSQWVNAARHTDGRTPLLALWQAVEEELEERTYAESPDVWRETRALLEQGADLSIGQGPGYPSAAEVLHECVQNGMHVSAGFEDLAEQLASHAQAARLQHGTTRVGTQPGARRI